MAKEFAKAFISVQGGRSAEMITLPKGKVLMVECVKWRREFLFILRIDK